MNPAFPIGTAEQVRHLEKRLIEEWNFPAPVLMERAALSIVHVLEHHYPDAPVVVMAGQGMNAADGLAAARMLLDRGHMVRILNVGATLGDVASRQMAYLNKRGLQAKTFAGAESFGDHWVVIDALFGTGLNRPLKSDAQMAIDWINRGSWRGVVSVDLPSGLNADNGQAMGALVRASHTVTFGALKPGLLADPALAAVGALWLADIGFPQALVDPLPGRLNQPAPLPRVGPDAHKGTLGTVMLVAGSATMSGAAILAARAACRSGVGLVYVATVQSQREMVALAVPEAIVIGLPEQDGMVLPEGVDLIQRHFARVKALALGPGMGHHPRVTAFVARALQAFNGPVVLDADALPREGERLPPREAPVILTPHAGELGRMVGRDGAEIQRERLNYALQAAKAHHAIVALKGARTVIARPDGQYRINTTGNAMLGTGGSGDVLTGLTAGLLARGMAAEDAIATAVYDHGRTAEIARESDMVSLVAGDVIDRIPLALGRIAPSGPRVCDAERIS